MIKDPLQKLVFATSTLVAKVDPSDEDRFQGTTGRIVLDQKESGKVRSGTG